jgi:hypothetical protein
MGPNTTMSSTPNKFVRAMVLCYYDADTIYLCYLILCGQCALGWAERLECGIV